MSEDVPGIEGIGQISIVVSDVDRTSIIYYRVPDIGRAADSLRAKGVAFEHEPRAVHKDERHELWLGFFKDTEGNDVALMSEVPVES